MSVRYLYELTRVAHRRCPEQPAIRALATYTWPCKLLHSDLLP
jgi:hypothetical protein